VTEREQGANQNAGRRLAPGEKALVWLGLISVLLLVASQYYEWIGLRGKTLWDWADLLIVPAVVAGGVFLLDKSQRDREQAAEGARREREQEVEESRREREMNAENRRTMDTALQAYLDQMSHLLLEKGLRGSEEDDDVRMLARARTLTVLTQLDPDRKGSVLRFLYEAGLISKSDPIIKLSGISILGSISGAADLSGVDLAFVYMGDADLSGTRMTEADLAFCQLPGADLREADLSNSKLSNGDFSGDDFRHTVLSETTFDEAILEGADLRDVQLWGNDLTGANLSKADLRGAELSGAHVALILGDAADGDFGDAILTGADLSRANLTEATITQEQLAQCASLEGTIMPDGTIHE
jgi:uncharacterized protein YjbI with pentapeptide repeats